MTEQFLLVAAAHFLALLSPGPDFFLVAQTSINAGWRRATRVCLGIAVANGLFITAAFSGVTLFRAGSLSFIAIQLTGCAYLLYIGQLFLRSAGTHTGLPSQPGAMRSGAEPAAAWYRSEYAMGFLSGILNPKNALFYVSLATMPGVMQTTGAIKIGYGLWMFSAVLLWDLLVAFFIGNRVVLQYFIGILPWLERISGVMLIVLALGVIMVNIIALAARSQI